MATASSLATAGLSSDQHRVYADPPPSAQGLEKPDLTLGFVPVNDCAPFVVAVERGLFAKYGLRVRLSREASWATARDGVIFGRLDAAPVVAGAVTNARLGAEGARRAPLCAAMTIHRHGNAITFNRAMWNHGLRPWAEYQGQLDRFGQELQQYFRGLPSHQRLWATVLSSSTYEYCIRYLVAAAGLDPDAEFRLMIFPPPQMMTAMRMGAMQAYMVGEPWNTRSIAAGVGFTFAHGLEIWRGHPDRVLAVMESFIERYPRTYRALVMALIEACQYCSLHREEVADLITTRAYTGVNRRFTRPALVGDYDYGGFDGQTRRRSLPDSTLFFDLPDDWDTPLHDHSTFLWQSQALWLVTQAVRWGQLPEIPVDIEQRLQRAWRTDLYREMATELGIPCPREDLKIEPPAAFIDGQAFDPGDPVGYVQQFPIRAQRPKTFAWS
ncbi:MAG: CmpA/NrtA family ABC transporter substrate-binding protein [Synechococcales cyanobacterium]